MPELSLDEKLHAIAEAVAFVEKRGYNAHHKYNYASAVDVVKTVRDELLKHKLIVIPGAHGATHLPYGSKGGHLTTVELTYTVRDVESGDHVEIPWVGVGADTGGDKGIYKAYTGGFKYALLSLFMIPTTDDPEHDQLTEPEPAPQRPAAPFIPMDRARSILTLAIQAGLASLDMEAPPGTPPEFSPVFRAKLATHGVDKIGNLNVDQAEDVEQWLHKEAKS